MAYVIQRLMPYPQGLSNNPLSTRVNLIYNVDFVHKHLMSRLENSA